MYVVKMKVLAVGLRVCLYEDHYTTANLFVFGIKSPGVQVMSVCLYTL